VTDLILIAAGAMTIVALAGLLVWIAIENARARGAAEQKASDLAAQATSIDSTGTLKDEIGEAAAQHPSDDQIEQRLEDHAF
jgi:hypothetical protein